MDHQRHLGTDLGAGRVAGSRRDGQPWKFLREQYRLGADVGEHNAAGIALAVSPEEAYWAAALTLADIPGATQLKRGRVYYWRLRARDSRLGYSSWSEGPHWFRSRFAPTNQPLVNVTAPTAGGALEFQWTTPDGDVFIEFTPALQPPQWRTVAGPVQGTSWTGTPDPAAPLGFYRVRIE